MTHATNGDGSHRREPYVVLGMPGYGGPTGGASHGFWRATRLPDRQIYRTYREGSLLANCFNLLWCDALNAAREGRRVDYFAMQHADIEPEAYWLDALIEEIEARDLDVLGVVAPIKDRQGSTSIALAHPSGDPYRILCRLTMAECYRLPETFTSQDIGHPLLLNTGLWICRFREEWARQVHFTINDEIVTTPDGKYMPRCEPEDWYFSRLCHELGLKIGCTRKVRLEHKGHACFTNTMPWGELYDSPWVSESQLPRSSLPGQYILPDCGGWLSNAEGARLAELARGKCVLEVGSYLGLSTISMARTAARVVSVDTHDGRGTARPWNTLGEFKANLERHGVADRVAVCVGTLAEHAPIFGDLRFDLIFIDGSHDEESVAADVVAALPLLEAGGLLVFHDCDSSHPGVSAAVDRLTSGGAALLSTTDSLAVVDPAAIIIGFSREQSPLHPDLSAQRTLRKRLWLRITTLVSSLFFKRGDKCAKFIDFRGQPLRSKPSGPDSLGTRTSKNGRPHLNGSTPDNEVARLLCAEREPLEVGDDRLGQIVNPADDVFRNRLRIGNSISSVREELGAAAGPEGLDHPQDFPVILSERD